MSAPTTDILLNQVTPAAPSGDQNVTFVSDGATPLQSITAYPRRATAALYGTTLLPVRTVLLTVDGGGSVPATGAVKRFGQVDFNGTIVGWAAFADASGSVSVDVWKKAGTPPPSSTPPTVPTSSDKISATAPVAISSAQSGAGGASAVSTWATIVAAGDSFGFSIASISTITAFTLEIYIQQS